MCQFPLDNDDSVSCEQRSQSLADVVLRTRAEDALAGFQRCASAEDSHVLARRHAAHLQRCAVLVSPKLMSSFDFEEQEQEEGEEVTCDKYHDAEFTSLSSAAASEAITRTSTRTSSSFTATSSSADFRASSSSAAFGRLSARPYHEAPTMERATSVSPTASQNAAEVGAYMLDAFSGAVL
ncbi:hypothetical protein T484DRAFT_1902097 [Baffinella frigidus]|jgi:hypothetical protein|nr:hypothetical protein T484DRAFT_1902096 [Cryptophyta sp. CCMP2293]KAJ1479821.1 hypothetical protein T484DRAFT_1902097 [Cryptophyta sp. CCMP2293]